MKSKRRDFLKLSGLAGMGLISSSRSLATAQAPAKDDSLDYPAAIQKIETTHLQRFNMSGYAAPAIETVRVGIIGMGQRGPTYIYTMAPLEGVEIKAICDVRPEKAEGARKLAEKYGHTPVVYDKSKNDWKKLCERDDIDLVIVTTPWTMHAEMGVYAMKQGKHTAIAVPASATIEECWQLVKTSEETKRHCLMLENCCYHNHEMITLNMARQGFYGEVVHGEGAYNSSKMHNNFSGRL